MKVEERTRGPAVVLDDPCEAGGEAEARPATRPAIIPDDKSREPRVSREGDDAPRIEARGKFLFQAGEKYWVRGVTYGTFRPNDGGEGEPFPERRVVGADFAAMAAAGINTLRTYVAPPRWLLDLASANGLSVMVGLAWEQHVAFLDDPVLRRGIEQRLREQVRSCGRHPAIFCYAVGNEIPSPIVRWHGRRRIEKFIKRLYGIVKEEDPGSLVTYVNYPTTEYLALGFLDVFCFNVYLEDRQKLDAYLYRLQNLSGGKPLLLGEIGLDSLRHGEQAQAERIEQQIGTAFSRGCCGAIVFAWTDEWHRGGVDIEDWAFGLCRHDRSPKPALDAVRRAYRAVPFPADYPWPSVSVVVCTHNGAATIRETLEHLAKLDYPDFEVIVIDDGSTDDTAAIVSGYEVTCIRTPNRGLSAARNLGWRESGGEIVAYIDDDAYPDAHWLQYLAWTFLTKNCAAAGGLSPAPPGGGGIADCVASAPGRPMHILLTDSEAEHIPGCNMAFRRGVLQELDGFDPRFTAAGDDVDMCWRILERGWTIEYHAAAVTWHHARNSVAAYWRQQRGYGSAEALLEEKWPDRYSVSGQLNWNGRIYSDVYTLPPLFGRGRIYQGQWGLAPFQSVYSHADRGWSALPPFSDYLLVLLLLACLAIMGAFWSPLLIALPLLVIALAAPIGLALAGGWRARFPTAVRSRHQRFARRLTTSLLFLLQPVARFRGRLKGERPAWRKRFHVRSAGRGNARRTLTVWSEKWQPHAQWLRTLENCLVAEKVPLSHGGDFDDWDMEIRGGHLGSARLLMAPEEHGQGRQFLRFSVRPRMSPKALGFLTVFGLGGLAAGMHGAWWVAAVFACLMLATFARFRREALTAALPFAGAICKLEALSRGDDVTRDVREMSPPAKTSGG